MSSGSETQQGSNTEVWGSIYFKTEGMIQFQMNKYGKQGCKKKKKKALESAVQIAFRNHSSGVVGTITKQELCQDTFNTKSTNSLALTQK